ncbi:MAG TPA: hypothetical protein VNS80_09125, partial [Pseudolysinimonas sp.]|nr:hypothetical protein [Pseudolysinimonas sp.]
MADDSGIDSRYAAQFQRGFDPTRHAESPTQRGPVRREGGPPATAPRVADPPRMAPSPAVTETDAVVPASPDDTDDTALTAPTWWDWLLPGVGAGLVLIAFMLWWSLGTDTSHYDGTGRYDEWS